MPDLCLGAVVQADAARAGKSFTTTLPSGAVATTSDSMHLGCHSVARSTGSLLAGTERVQYSLAGGAKCRTLQFALRWTSQQTNPHVPGLRAR
jgi:hypothetical protein